MRRAEGQAVVPRGRSHVAEILDSIRLMPEDQVVRFRGYHSGWTVSTYKQGPKVVGDREAELIIELGHLLFANAEQPQYIAIHPNALRELVRMKQEQDARRRRKKRGKK
jgi:hypothetical protein